MRLISSVFLVALFLIPSGTALDLERVELPGNVSLIISPLRENYYILTLVNQNDFNLTLVKNIHFNLSFEIDPASVHAVDNYKSLVEPVEIRSRSIIFNYNATLPAMGYGKIFLDVKRLPPTPQPTPLPEPKKTLPPPSSPPPTAVTNSPPITPPVTQPAPSIQPEPVDQTENAAPPSPPPTVEPPKPATPQLPTTIQIIIGIFLLEMLAGLITLKT